MTPSEFESIRRSCGLDRPTFNRLVGLSGRRTPGRIPASAARRARTLYRHYERFASSLLAELRRRPVFITARDASLLLGITDTNLATLARRGAIGRAATGLYSTFDLEALFLPPVAGTQYHSPLQQTFLDWLERKKARSRAA